MRKTYNIWLLLIAVLTLASCKQEIDDVFDKSSSERISEAIKEDMDILVAQQNGWLMNFYGSTTYGGYNVICKFNNDNTVTVASEAGAPGDSHTSHFKIEQSQGIILSFDEHNPLFHYFSDPHNPDGMGTDGTGMNGDFEFRVNNVTPDSVILYGKKHGGRIVMTPMKDSNYEGYLTQVETTEKKMNFNEYMLVFDKQDTIYLKRSYRNLSFVDAETKVTVKLPFITTPTGFVLNTPFEYKGKTITRFDYSDEPLWYNGTDKTVYLTPYVRPANEQFINGQWFLSYSNAGEFAQQYLNVVKQGVDNLGEKLIWMSFGTYDLDGSSKSTYLPEVGISFNSGGYLGQLLYNYKLVGEDKITLSFAGQGISNGIWYYKNAKFDNLIPIFGSSSAPRTFQITTDNLLSPSYMVLTDVSNPKNVIKLVARYVSYPFEN